MFSITPPGDIWRKLGLVLLEWLERFPVEFGDRGGNNSKQVAILFLSSGLRGGDQIKLSTVTVLRKVDSCNKLWVFV